MPLPKQIVLQEHPVTAIIDSILDPIVRIAERKIQSDKSDKLQLAGLLERESVRKQGQIDGINDKIEESILSLQDMSGVLHSLPKTQQTGANKLYRDLKKPIVEGLQSLNSDLEEEQKRLTTQLNNLLGEVEDAKVIQGWFAGVGHSPEEGIDKFRYDIGEFTPEELNEYLKEYHPNIKTGAGRSAFVKGTIAKGRAHLDLTIRSLNKSLDIARTSELTTKVHEINYARTLSSASKEDLDKLQKARDESLYTLVKPYALASGNTGLNRAINASALEGKEKGDKGYDEALVKSNLELEMVGMNVTYIPNAHKANLELGAEIVSGNMRFRESSKNQINISRTDYTGWTRSLEKINHYAIINEKQLSPDQFKIYKRKISKIVGMEYNYFMESYYPSLEKGIENRDKDALSQATSALNTAVSGTGYSTFDEEFRDLYRTALTSKAVSGEEDFINTNIGELWKLAKDKYGFTQEDFARYLEDF